jgi:hypothetical protein
VKLGKLAPKPNRKTLSLAKYLSPELPKPPIKVYREYKVADWGMFANDIIGDCTCAAVAHMVMLFTSHTGKLVVPELVDVLKMYSALTGYDSAQTDSDGNNPTDTGAAITDVLDYWQTIGLSGHKILGWAQIDHTSLLAQHQGVWLFGALDVGVQLPANAQKQFEAGKNWEVTVRRSPIEGGHCIVEPGYGRKGRDYISWGKGDQKASDPWGLKYVDEGYVVFADHDWIDEATGLAPNGFNASELRKDLKAIAA